MSKSFECFLEARIEQFTYDDFDPHKVSELRERFREIFYVDTAYWIKKNEDLTIEFKKYGENKKEITLKFDLNNKDVLLYLRDMHEPVLCVKEKKICLSDIWTDHSKLFNKLKNLMLEGLNKASAT